MYCNELKQIQSNFHRHHTIDNCNSDTLLPLESIYAQTSTTKSDMWTVLVPVAYLSLFYHTSEVSKSENMVFTSVHHTKKEKNLGKKPKFRYDVLIKFVVFEWRTIISLYSILHKITHTICINHTLKKSTHLWWSCVMCASSPLSYRHCSHALANSLSTDFSVSDRLCTVINLTWSIIIIIILCKTLNRVIYYAFF